MPVLGNAKHELFAQAMAKGSKLEDAMRDAGYAPNRANGVRVYSTPGVKERIEELLAQRQVIDQLATMRAIRTLQIDKERVLGELARIAFSDIRKLVKWSSSKITEIDNKAAAPGEPAVVRNIVTNEVEIVPSAELDDDTAAAIAEIWQTNSGAVRIRMHDKQAALVDIGRHLGMFPTRVEMKIDHRKAPTEYTDAELAEIIEAGRGNGAAKQTNGSDEPDKLH